MARDKKAKALRSCAELSQIGRLVHVVLTTPHQDNNPAAHHKNQFGGRCGGY